MNPPPTPPQSPLQRAFPVPVVALGPGSQPEDEALDVIPMPQSISTWETPILPEPEAFAQHQDALAVLRRVREALRRAAAGEAVGPIDLDGLPPQSLALLGEVLGEGEVAVRIAGEAGGLLASGLDAQESVYNGVWRVICPAGDGQPLRDRIEVGAVPASVLDFLRRSARSDLAAPVLPTPLPAGVVNAPAIIAEIAEQAAQPRAPGTPAHVLNLSLLPLSPEDRACIADALGEGRVLILSRGYGNCRIRAGQWPQTWRVVYFNHNDTTILDTVEVVDMPAAALAAPEDLVDALERLDETLEWLARDNGAA